jgi:hypothetical protein
MQRFFVRVFAADGAERKPLAVTFDSAFSALGELPKMFIEPDGSFVWTSPAGVAAWQVDGILVDGGTTLYYCELKGCCPRESLERLLACLSDGTTRLVFEAVERGVLMAEDEFRRSLTSLPDGPELAPDRQE